MDATLSMEQYINDALEMEMPLERMIFRGEEIEGADGGRVELRFVRFENCRLISCDFTKAYFERVEFVNCDCSNCIFSETYWKDSAFLDTKAQGVKFTEAVLRGTVFKGCKLDYANFGQVVMENSALEDCSLISAFLSEMRLKRAEFVRDRFDSTDFFKTSLKGVDLSTCELEGPLLSEDFREIRGAKLSPAQAVEVARMLGIVVV